MSVVEKYAIFCEGDAHWRGAQKLYVRRVYIAELIFFSNKEKREGRTERRAGRGSTRKKGGWMEIETTTSQARANSNTAYTRQQNNNRSPIKWTCKMYIILRIEKVVIEQVTAQ